MRCEFDLTVRFSPFPISRFLVLQQGLAPLVSYRHHHHWQAAQVPSGTQAITLPLTLEDNPTHLLSALQCDAAVDLRRWITGNTFFFTRHACEAASVAAAAAAAVTDDEASLRLSALSSISRIGPITFSDEDFFLSGLSLQAFRFGDLLAII